MRKIYNIIIWTLIISLLISNTASAQEEIPAGIEINIPARTLTVYSKEGDIAVYPVAVGSPDTPTPTGQYYIAEKSLDPVWYPMPEPVEKVDEKGNVYTVMESPEPVPPGPDNPLGKYWMGLDRDELGIHSTNNPSSIGYSVSHGCIRMHPSDVPYLFNIAYTGLRVDIVYRTTDIDVDNETGTIYVAAYPDIYGKGLESYEAIEKKLEKTGIPYDRKILRETLDDLTGQYVMVSMPYRVILEGEDCQINTIYPKEKFKSGKKDFYISQRDWNKFSENIIEWNEEDGKAYIKNTPLDSVIYNGRNYVNVRELAKLLDLECSVDLKEKNITLYSVIMYLNSLPLEKDGRIINKKPFISVKKFFEELGLNFSWDGSNKTATFADTKLKCNVISGKAYVPVETLAEHFTLEINRKDKRIIDIIYPVIYLNEMTLKKKAFLYHGEIYVSLREMANLSGIDFEWKEGEKIAFMGNKNIEARNLGGTTFLPLSSLYKTGVVDIERPDGSSIKITLTKVVINNSFFSIEGYKDGSSEEIMLLIDDLASALNENFEYNPQNKEIKIHGESLPVQPRKEGLYISLSSLKNLKDISIDYDSKNRIIAIFCQKQENSPVIPEEENIIEE